MKKALFFIRGCDIRKYGEYTSCRGEGRAIINQAFGFSLLGFECHVLSSDSSLIEPKKIWNNVYLIGYLNPNDYYDVSLIFCNNVPLEYNTDKIGHKIIMNYDRTDELINEIKEKNLNITVVCPVPSIMNDERTFQYKSKDVLYLPGLNPLPSVSVGFLPYKFEPKNSELKIYLIHSSWPSSITRSSYYVHKQLVTLEYIKSIGYEINLFVQIENKDVINDCPFIKNDYKKFNYIINDDLNYRDIVNIIQEVDLCIPNRAGLDAYGSSVTDIISLGKPMINIVDGNYHDGFIHNGMYKCLNDLILIQETDHDTNEKLEVIFKDLKKSYDCFKKQLIDTDFNNWKIYAEKVLYGD